MSLFVIEASICVFGIPVIGPNDSIDHGRGFQITFSSKIKCPTVVTSFTPNDFCRYNFHLSHAVRPVALHLSSAVGRYL